MNTRKIELLLFKFIVFLLIFFPIDAYSSELITPKLDVSINGITANVSWSSIPEADGYLFWYKSYFESDSWEYVYFDKWDNGFTVDLWDDAAFYITVQAYKGNEYSEFATKQFVYIGNIPSEVPDTPEIHISVEGKHLNVNWSQVNRAEAYVLYYQQYGSDKGWEKAYFPSDTLSLSGELWDGAAFYGAICAINGKGYSGFSGTEFFYIGQTPESATPFFSEVLHVFPANSKSPYSSVLQDCAYSNSRKRSCSLNTLPLIGQEHDNPSIEDIMNRVAVSHSWMANRFRRMLEELPDNILDLFKAITAIVISSDIRPSFYDDVTGAIYLDPRYLWLNSEEKETIDKAPDYRSECGDELSYETLQIYTRNGDYAYKNLGWSEESREIDDIKYWFARLLYHELAHANDYFPAYVYEIMTKDITAHVASYSNKGNRISDHLAELYPLESDLLKGLAQVKYGCEEPSEVQKSIKPWEYATNFEGDMANCEYNYYTVREDLAMLFEEVMMFYSFRVEANFAIVHIPSVENPTFNDYVVEWGQRRRFTDFRMREKANFAVSQIFPHKDFSSFFNSLPEPVAMMPGVGYRDNLYLETGARSSLKKRDSEAVYLEKLGRGFVAPKSSSGP